MINITQQILFFNLVSRALFFLLSQIVWVSATVVLTHFLFTGTVHCSPVLSLFTGTVTVHRYCYCSPVLLLFTGTVTVHRYCYCSPVLFRFCFAVQVLFCPCFNCGSVFRVVPLYPLVGILLLLFHGREEKFDFLCIFWFSHHYV